MFAKKDSIVEIAPKHRPAQGGSDRMLLPGLQTVAALIAKIPAGALMTTAGIQTVLSKQYDVQRTCPDTLRHALIALSQDETQSCPYWRVTNRSGGLLAYFPGGRTRQAARLEAEGISIEARSKTIGVADIDSHLLTQADFLFDNK